MDEIDRFIANKAISPGSLLLIDATLIKNDVLISRDTGLLIMRKSIAERAHSVGLMYRNCAIHLTVF